MSRETILGVRFLVGPVDDVVDGGLAGGLVVVPSAPVLVGLAESEALREAVLGADLAVADSGFMVLLWRLLKGRKIERVSGLEYLKVLLQRLKESEAQGRSARVFWVMPTRAAQERNLAWLRSEGFPVSEEDCYLAPHYPAGALVDEALVARLMERRPAHIILAIGGGVQERLGWFLRQRLAEAGEGGAPYRPGIHCIGAAIGFLSGEQVRIPMWVDYVYLGWLWRCVSAPRRFVPRYWKALRLAVLMVRYGAEAPEAR